VSAAEKARHMRALAAEIGKGSVVRVSAEQLTDWANAIDPQGFIVTGLSNKAIVRKFSEMGVLEDIMREACALYGLELVLSEGAKYTLELQQTTEHNLGFHIGKLLTDAKTAHNVWMDFNITFKLTSEGALVAVEGLKETHA
jgi:hypothetical protein